jgi:hypothetical protein
MEILVRIEGFAKSVITPFREPFEVFPGREPHRGGWLIVPGRPATGRNEERAARSDLGRETVSVRQLEIA